MRRAPGANPLTPNLPVTSMRALAAWQRRGVPEDGLYLLEAAGDPPHRLELVPRAYQSGRLPASAVRRPQPDRTWTSRVGSGGYYRRVVSSPLEAAMCLAVSM